MYTANSQLIWEDLLPKIIHCGFMIHVTVKPENPLQLPVAKRNISKEGPKAPTLDKNILEEALKSDTPFVRSMEQEKRRQEMEACEFVNFLIHIVQMPHLYHYNCITYHILYSTPPTWGE